VSQQDLKGIHRFLDVLHLLSPFIHETQIELAAHLVVELSRDEDASRFRQRLKPRRHVDTISIKVIAFYDNVAHVQAHPELHLVFRIDFVVAVTQVFLKLHRRHNCINRTAELGNY